MTQRNVVTLDKLELRAILASATGKGIVQRGIMKNKQKTIYWYFIDSEVKKDKKK